MLHLNNTPLLLDARAEYLDQLTDAVLPSMAKYLNVLYADVQRAGRSAHLVFRQRLVDIAGWNATIIRERTQDVLTACPYFSNLVCAIIVAHVKVLSSIKVRKDSTSVRVKVPNDDAVVHAIYAETAKALLLSSNLVKSRKELRVLMRESTETAIKSFLPLKSLLDAYLGNSVDQVTGTIVARDDDDDDDDYTDEDDDGDDDDDDGDGDGDGDEYDDEEDDVPLQSLKSLPILAPGSCVEYDGTVGDMETDPLVDAHFSAARDASSAQAGMVPLRDVSPENDIKRVPLTSSSIPDRMQPMPTQKSLHRTTTPATAVENPVRRPPHPAFMFDDEQDDFQ